MYQRDSAFFEDDEDNDLYTGAPTTALEQKEDDDDDDEEDSYEVPPPILVEYPASDDKKFPQENKQYFATKKYVRKDKYKLDHLVPKEMKLPPLSSIYKM